MLRIGRVDHNKRTHSLTNEFVAALLPQSVDFLNEILFLQ